MRHRLGTRWVIAVAAAAMLSLGAGCGQDAGVDGDLLNDWTAMAPATGFEPKAGTCHLSNFAVSGPRSTYEEVDCKLRHRTETVHVGAYPSPAADAAEPPGEGSAGARTAYRTCDAKTTEYVGGEWRTARLWIGVTHPSPSAWTGGARWYRCELVELDSIEDDGALVERVGSLRGALGPGGASKLLLTCYAIKMDDTGAIDTMPAADCGSKHNAEFVGLWDAGDLSYPKGDAAWAKFHDGCRGVLAAYVGVPDDKDLQYRTGVVSLPGNADVWSAGDHTVRCYLWLSGGQLTSSLKGKGSKALPVQFK